MTTMLLLALAAAPPRVALMTGSRVGVSEKEAAQLSARLSAQLKAAGLTVLEVNLPCQGDAACLQTQGRDVGVEAVVSITLASGPRQVAIDVETVLVATGASIDQRSLNWKNKQPVELIDPLLRECAEAIALKVIAQRPVDAPVKVALTPEVVVTPAPLITAPPPGVNRTPELVVGGGAVALGIVAAVLTGIAAGQQHDLAAAKPFTLTPVEANAQRDAANGTYTSAAVTGGLAGALAITTVTLFLVR